ncbi:ATP-binding protein [Collinsella sp. zg1085]|uniref:ATP-binding protein n=1 Tax=Collinsella sp. zg1085 TaxID=2844380 RepID=UPI001C0D4EBA|nr:ATP-binding protein [Collinsella sp. zg1085]QWT17582.1 ATP-binding protein [Collinsella sp. zg1085]
MFERKQVATLVERMQETTNPLIQVVVGPRQTGKSTMLSQALAKLDGIHHVVSADDPIEPSANWLQLEWQQARNMTNNGQQPVLLVIDEIQKVPHWPNTIKALWDADRRSNAPLKVFLSGSSSLLLHKGLEDSLMGRFELIRSPHWSLQETREAFGYTLDDYLYFGGYPGAARFSHDVQRWAAYMRDAVIEPSISQDVLAMEDIRKPALMRALFRLAAAYSGQELSFNKMLGQLQDAGNTVTVAHYLELLQKAGMIAALPKYALQELGRRRSSPRLMVFDTSLMTALSEKSRERLLGEPDLRGHIVESAVGAFLLAQSSAEGFDVGWWREAHDEVDFVLQKGSAITAIEVKSGKESSQSGMAAFLQKNPQAKRIIVGGSSSGACSIEEFLLGNIELFYS